MPAAHVQWELKAASVLLSKGSTPLPPDQRATLHIVAPQVRVRTAITFAYRVISDVDQRELASGDSPINVFPASIAWGQSLNQRQLALYDPRDSLPKAFANSPLKLTRIEDLSKLDPSDADVILVADGALAQDAIAQSQLQRLVTAGTSAIILRQPDASALLGYAIHPRRSDSQIKWRHDHPLFAGLTPDDLPTLAPSSSTELACLSLPSPDAALAYWPAEPADASRIDALVAIKKIGAGKAILWQLPLGDPLADPRSRLILRNALEYAASAGTAQDTGTSQTNKATAKPTSIIGTGDQK